MSQLISRFRPSEIELNIVRQLFQKGWVLLCRTFCPLSSNFFPYLYDALSRMSNVPKKSILPKQKQRRKQANPAPQNLRIFCHQVEAGNTVLQTHMRELSNAVTAITEGISTIRVQLAQERQRLRLLWSMVASVLGKTTMDLAQVAGAPSNFGIRACSKYNSVGSSHTPAKEKRRSQCDDEDEVTMPTRKRCRRSANVEHFLPPGQETYFRLLRREGVSSPESTGPLSPSCFSKEYSRSNPHPSSLPSPMSFPTDYSNPHRPKSPHLRSPPRSPGMRHQDWFYESFDSDNERWLFIRDRRATEKWKHYTNLEREEVWRSYGDIQLNFEQCCQSVDTAYEFAFHWQDYDVPYAGSDNVLTPSHPDYPSDLGDKSPPEPRRQKLQKKGTHSSEMGMQEPVGIQRQSLSCVSIPSSSSWARWISPWRIRRHKWTSEPPKYHSKLFVDFRLRHFMMMDFVPASTFRLYRPNIFIFKVLHSARTHFPGFPPAIAKAYLRRLGDIEVDEVSVALEGTLLHLMEEAANVL
ncbi:hypothetical protein D9613_002519 [Agrocybe pediades]|uniref:Uncharacterized protein n=1 Tax=Agrocybe pediades TaxID=84607 RepID=A0A8H4QQD6_9AGAR|nr:hypothetical protein D9613_002519 [Agrocybe pediades]